MTKRRQFLLASLCAALVLPVAWRTAHSAGETPPPEGWMAQFIRYAPARPAPDTPFVRENGDVVTLQAFKGKVVLVNFWATWCAPCIREMPSLDRLAAALGHEDFLVAAVSVDRGGAKVARPFLDKLGVKELQLFFDPKMALAVKLGVRGMPTTFLVDRGGRVAGALVGIAEWDSPEAEALVRSYLKSP
ncbi:MAG: TlpA family protein disulfide reductase [Rhodospirillaceae bacterium]|jgi:thiol-disulfide isomerase/thioredoxin|nr:TlpA family protein disulfide reductase [Rhodospirillaceae bacterium]MBT5666614.1 TlpA family protein disulfide reductase [Rhodospirillaceae bacterium]